MASSPLGQSSAVAINTNIGSVLPCGLVLQYGGSGTAATTPPGGGAANPLCRGGGGGCVSSGAMDPRIGLPGTLLAPGAGLGLQGAGFDPVSALQLARLSRYQAAAAAAAIINGGTVSAPAVGGGGSGMIGLSSGGEQQRHQMTSSSLTGHHLLSYYLYARHQQQQRLQQERNCFHGTGNRDDRTWAVNCKKLSVKTCDICDIFAYVLFYVLL